MRSTLSPSPAPAKRATSTLMPVNSDVMKTMTTRMICHDTPIAALPVNPTRWPDQRVIDDALKPADDVGQHRGPGDLPDRRAERPLDDGPVESTLAWGCGGGCGRRRGIGLGRGRRGGRGVGHPGHPRTTRNLVRSFQDRGYVLAGLPRYASAYFRPFPNRGSNGRAAEPAGAGAGGHLRVPARAGRWGHVPHLPRGRAGAQPPRGGEGARAGARWPASRSSGSGARCCWRPSSSIHM